MSDAVKMPESFQQAASEAQAAVKSIDGLSGFLYAIYERWLDERGYEDLSGYDKVLREKFSAFSVVKTTQRPFGLQFKTASALVTLKMKKSGGWATTNWSCRPLANV